MRAGSMILETQQGRPYFRHSSAQWYGEVVFGEHCSLWCNSVIRSEMYSVSIGAYSNIQDFVMIHVGDRGPSRIGSYCSIAHRAVIHGAAIGDNCLVGVGSILMDGCEVGENSIIGAKVCLPAGTKIPSGVLSPAGPANKSVYATTVSPINSMR